MLRNVSVVPSTILDAPDVPIMEHDMIMIVEWHPIPLVQCTNAMVCSIRYNHIGTLRDTFLPPINVQDFVEQHASALISQSTLQSRQNNIANHLPMMPKAQNQNP